MQGCDMGIALAKAITDQPGKPRVAIVDPFPQLTPRQPVVFNDMTVTPYQLDHPDPCWGYRFESNGKVLSYCVDSEI